MHYVQFVKYDVTVSFMAQVIDTVTYLVHAVHAPVADTVAYFADLDAPVLERVTYFGGNHRSRV